MTGADFRDPAVAASEDYLQRHPGRPPGAQEASLCLRAEPWEDQRMRRTGVLQFVAIAGGFLALGLGGLLLARAYGLDEEQDGRPPVPALVAPGWLVTGLSAGAMFWGLFLADRRKQQLMRAAFSRRPDSLLPRGHALPEFFVELEDLATFDQGKLNPEDHALLAVDRDRQRILIEGRTHRYVIRREDLVAWRGPRGARTSNARLMVRIAGDDDVILAITLAYGVVLRQVASNFWIGRRTLALVMQHALGEPAWGEVD